MTAPLAGLRVFDLTRILAGPTCEELDVLYEHTPYPLPKDLRIGDRVVFESAGAYTWSYSAVCFNGVPPLKQYVI